MIDKELIPQAAEDIDIFQADLTEEYDRIKKSLSPRPLPKERGLKFWPLAIAACLVGFVVIFLAPPRTTEEPIASSQEPRVESQVPTTSSQEPIASSQEPIASSQEPIASSQEPIASSQEPRANSQRPKANSQQATQPSPKGGDGGGLPKAKSQQPIEEPMLAEAEINSSHLGEVGRGAHPEMEDPLLAVAAQIQDIRSRGERLGREIAQLTDNKIKYQ
ncbi:MAG: hypothetical protein J6W21_04205 [Bacteroidaceae bacterium]|nr:hypothetical protein [Bacteroidaceae bacterium]